MPTCYTRHALFHHVPKTGGQFVVHAITASGVPVCFPRLLRPSYDARFGHPRYRELRWDLRRIRLGRQRRFSFGFVRYPPDWWRSYWAYRMATGWWDDHEIDSHAQSPIFEEFIENVVERLPGFLGDYYERFLGPPGAVDFEGQSEALEDGLVTALTLAGESFNVAAIRRSKPMNVTPQHLRRPHLPEVLLEALLASETVATERYRRASGPGQAETTP